MAHKIEFERLAKPTLQNTFDSGIRKDLGDNQPILGYIVMQNTFKFRIG